MLIKHSDQVPSVVDCDYCGSQSADSSKGYAVVSRGATGRYCEVLWLCNTCGEMQADPNDLPTVSEARLLCNSKPGAYADF